MTTFHLEFIIMLCNRVYELLIYMKLMKSTVATIGVRRRRVGNAMVVYPPGPHTLITMLHIVSIARRFSSMSVLGSTGRVATLSQAHLTASTRIANGTQVRSE